VLGHTPNTAVQWPPSSPLNDPLWQTTAFYELPPISRCSPTTCRPVRFFQVFAREYPSALRDFPRKLPHLFPFKRTITFFSTLRPRHPCSSPSSGRRTIFPLTNGKTADRTFFLMRFPFPFSLILPRITYLGYLLNYQPEFEYANTRFPLRPGAGFGTPFLGASPTQSEQKAAQLRVPLPLFSFLRLPASPPPLLPIGGSDCLRVGPSNGLHNRFSRVSQVPPPSIRICFCLARHLPSKTQNKPVDNWSPLPRAVVNGRSIFSLSFVKAYDFETALLQ